MKILSILLSIILLIAPTTTSPKQENVGFLRISVVDGMTAKAVQDATVCIPEIERYFKTDENGYTEKISLPIASNLLFKSSMPRNWGEVTVIVYKDGYLPCVLFSTMVKDNITRLGPTIYLYPKSNLDTDPKISVELPDKDWTHNLLEKYMR